MSVIACLIALLCWMGNNLYRDLRELSTADTDNMQWTVLQLETEFANLASTLTEAIHVPAADRDRVRLRTDITLSRIGLIGAGQGRDLFADDDQASSILARLERFAEQAAAIIDAPTPLTRNKIGELRDLTEALRPDVRRLALKGLVLSASIEEERRAVFARQLLRTGGATMLMIAALTGALMLLCRLLTNARQKDAHLNATTERLASTVAASLDGIIIADETGKIVDYNRSAEGIFGWTRDEIIGRRMEQTIVPPIHRDGHIRGMARYVRTREPHVIDAGRVELTALRKSGEEFPVELNITSATQTDGELFIAYLRDISEQKINERKLIDARDQAERTDRAKSRFLTIMSHEMRTPLNGILGVLDLLRTTKLTSQQERYVKVAAASGEILLEHVNEALDITRIETGEVPLSPQRFTMSELINRVVDVLQPLADERGLTLRAKIEPTMNMDFVADSGRIGQILTNLIGNAIKFTESGSVTVRVAGIHDTETTAASIDVEDTGPGINSDNLEDIFGDFVVMARSGGRQSRGDGLGLSISRKVARLMGGDLNATSLPGRGSTFTLTLPLERSEPDTVETDPLAEAPSSTVSRSILIVEDNVINRSVIKDMLVGFGHHVTEAANGLDGVKAADGQAFDLIIMDISMPVMDGIEAVRRIRAGTGPNCKTHILGLTAHGREEYRTKAVAAGMNGFCTKPIRLATLREQLDSIDMHGGKSPTMSAAIAEDVVSELIDALGQERFGTTIDRFFTEMDAAIRSLNHLQSGQDCSEISEISHKLRGGAVMLGLRDLANHIDIVGSFKDRVDQTAYQSAIDALTGATQDAQTNLRARLTPDD